MTSQAFLTAMQSTTPAKHSPNLSDDLRSECQARDDRPKLGDALTGKGRTPIGSRLLHPTPAHAWASPLSSSRLVILNDESIARGGATKLALLEAELLRRRGLPVTFITGDENENDLFKRLEIPVVALGQSRLLTAGFREAALRGLHNRATVSVIRDWIRRNDTPETVYHLHSWSQVLSPSVFAALASVSGRLVVTAHDFFLACPNGAFANFAAGTSCPLKPMSLRCLATACDRRNHAHKLWRAGRQGLQSQWLARLPSRPRVLMIHEAMREPLRRGGVPDATLSALPNPVVPWSRHRIEAESNTDVFFVGRLTEEKGPDLAARAARRAGVRLSMIGDGPLLDKLRNEFAEVRFLGRLTPERIPERIRSARTLVMPSRYPEPYGLAAVEALWSGLPVILAESALLAPDIVERGAGLSCDPRNEEAMAEAMATIVKQDGVARGMSIRAFDATRDLGLSPDAWADGLLRVFDEVLSRVAPSLRSEPREARGSA